MSAVVVVATVIATIALFAGLQGGILLTRRHATDASVVGPLVQISGTSDPHDLVPDLVMTEYLIKNSISSRAAARDQLWPHLQALGQRAPHPVEIKPPPARGRLSVWLTDELGRLEVAYDVENWTGEAS